MAVKKPDSKAKKDKSSASSAGAKSKSKSKQPPRAKLEVKTQRTSLPQKKKKKEYTDEELNLPKLNGIIPTGIQKQRGKKKGKVFVDDAETMLGILAVVNAEKEGEREGKLLKARQLEEIREARRREIEQRAEAKKEKLEATKDQLRRKRNRKSNDVADRENFAPDPTKPLKKKKKVSFG